MTSSATLRPETRAISICGHLIGGALLTALPFVVSGAYIPRGPDIGVASALCIGTAFLVGMAMIVKGLCTCWVVFKEYDDRDTDSACF